MDEAVLELVRMGIPPEVAQKVVMAKRQEKFDRETAGPLSDSRITSPDQLPHLQGNPVMWNEKAHAQDLNTHLLTVLNSIAGDESAPMTPASNQVKAATGRRAGGQLSVLASMYHPGGNITKFESGPISGRPGFGWTPMSPDFKHQGGPDVRTSPPLPSPPLSPQTPLNTNLQTGSMGNYRPGAGIYLHSPPGSAGK